MLLNYVMGTLFIVLPTFWVAALGWAGIHAGGPLQGLINGTGDAKAAGGKVSNMAFGGAMKMAGAPAKKK